MIVNKLFVISTLAAVVIVYLFVTAPPPLEEEKSQTTQISIAKVFEIVNEENRVVRGIYTQDIVGEGKKAGIKFDENWRDADVEAGMLPAQFLRATAVSLEKSKVRLGLYLGSDFPINSANKFTGEQLEKFNTLKQTGHAQYFFVKDINLYSYMFADIAVAEPCVKCHNNHKDSPKNDWRLNDVMGATTWTYPAETVSFDEVLTIISTLRSSFREAYAVLLKKVSSFTQQPVVGEKWPRDGFYLPSLEEFMRVVEQRASSNTLNKIVELVNPTQNVTTSN